MDSLRWPGLAFPGEAAGDLWSDGGTSENSCGRRIVLRTISDRGNGGSEVGTGSGAFSSGNAALDFFLDNDRKRLLAPPDFFSALAPVEGKRLMLVEAGLWRGLWTAEPVGAVDVGAVEEALLAERFNMPLATSMSLSCPSSKPTARPAAMNLMTAESVDDEGEWSVSSGGAVGFDAIASASGTGSMGSSSLRPRLVLPITCCRPGDDTFAVVDCDRVTGCSALGKRNASRSGDWTWAAVKLGVIFIGADTGVGCVGLNARRLIGSANLFDFAVVANEDMSGELDTERPLRKPNLRQRAEILLPEPLAFSNALATSELTGVVTGAPLSLTDVETNVGLEMIKAPFLVFFRVRPEPTDGVRFNAAVAAAMRASKSRRTSGSSAGVTRRASLLLELDSGVETSSSDGVSAGRGRGCLLGRKSDCANRLLALGDCFCVYEE